MTQVARQAWAKMGWQNREPDWLGLGEGRNLGNEVGKVGGSQTQESLESQAEMFGTSLQWTTGKLGSFVRRGDMRRKQLSFEEE